MNVTMGEFTDNMTVYTANYYVGNLTFTELMSFIRSTN